ncbi:MAG: [protein-PII] uridylyltransferase [Alphaproteobacteria bacterium]
MSFSPLPPVASLEAGTADPHEGEVKALLHSFREARKQAEQLFFAKRDGLSICKHLTHHTDRLLQGLFHLAVKKIHPLNADDPQQKILLLAVGGYGRRELAPFSDIDLLFVLPNNYHPKLEEVITAILYPLWDTGLKIGHAARSLDESIHQATADAVIRTALLDRRYLAGSTGLWQQFNHLIPVMVPVEDRQNFITAKLEEQDKRHILVGDSRFILEPNIKEAKGGLRDLHSLWWISRSIFGANSLLEMKESGLLRVEDIRQFKSARKLLLDIRCGLHYVSSRADDRLTFDKQAALGEIFYPPDEKNPASSLEIRASRLMQDYFRAAKNVGGLVRVICAVLEDRFGRAPSREKPIISQSAMPAGFSQHNNRIKITDAHKIAENPLILMQVFALAARHRLDIHPEAMNNVRLHLGKVNALFRRNPEANNLFIEVLTGNDPERYLRMMAETGLLGRFIPDFAWIESQMQFDMYHVYTVDEHTLRAIGLLHALKNGLLQQEAPLAHLLINSTPSYKELILALFFHDIAKGRGGDHSILGARVALRLCTRFQLSAEETETICWLVRWHLSLSHQAFKRDVEDMVTVREFAAIVQSPERLRLLTILTVIDIMAVGPGRWTQWKAELINRLYERCMEVFGGALPMSREMKLKEAIYLVRQQLASWQQQDIDNFLQLGFENYWNLFDPPTHANHAVLIRETDLAGQPLAIQTRLDPRKGVMELTVYTTNHPHAFPAVTGSIALAHGNIVDAKSASLNNGMVLMSFMVDNSSQQSPFITPDKRARLAVNLEKALTGQLQPSRELAVKKSSNGHERAAVFDVPARVIINNQASENYTLIEVNGKDRAGLLHDLAAAITDQGFQLVNARVSTYGLRIVDVFYVRDIFGHKISNDEQMLRLKKSLLAVL